MDTRSGTTVRIALVAAVYAAAAGGTVAVMARNMPSGVRLTEHAAAGLCAIGMLEWLLAVMVVPLWRRTYGTGWAFVLAAGLVLSSLAASLTVPAGRAVFGVNVILHAYLLSFMLVVLGATCLVANAFSRRWAGQTAALFLGIVLAGNIALAEKIFELLPASRNGMTNVVLMTNPVPVCGGILHYDVMRKQNMYNISSIGSHRFAYPEWQWPVLGHLAAGVILLVLNGMIERLCDEQRIDIENRETPQG